MNNLPWDYDHWRTTPPEEPEEIRCPCCGSTTWESLYWSEKEYEYVGCTDCLMPHETWEVAEKGVLNAED